MKYITYRKKMAAQRKGAMKTTEDDLKGMIKEAVKEALGEEDKDDGGEDIVMDDISDVVADAIEAINEKRKSAKEDPISEEVAAEILEAISEDKSEEDEDKDEEVDIADAIVQAVESVNEKRKSRKEDAIGEDDTTEIVDAVVDLISEAAEGEKRKNASRKTRQMKYSRTPARTPIQRKYSSIYMSGGSMEKKKEKKEVPTPVLMARAIKCIDVWGNGDPEKAAHYAKSRYGDESMSREFKALSATVGSEGGYLIPEVYADQIIELLYPKTVIFELGAQKVPLTNGNLNMPKMTAGSRAQWGGEKRKIESSNPTFGNIKLSAKRLQAIIPQTKELLMSSDYSADQIFANDLMRRMQLGLDYGAFYGTGGDYQPTGIMNNKKIEVLDAQKLEKDLSDGEGRITADLPVFVRSKAFMKNIDDSFAGWAMNSMLEGVFMNMKTSSGDYVYRDEMITGKLLGFPYRISNQIAVKNKMTDLIFGNWSDMLVGDQMGLETYTTLDGSWTDENGNSHNAFDENMSATRATMYDDIGVRHEESFLRTTNIKVE